MAILPLVEEIEGEGDATVDHQPWAVPRPGGRHQTNAMGAPLVDVKNVGFVVSQMPPQPRGGNRVPWASKGELEELETGVGTGQLEIAARTAPDPRVMSPKGKTSGRLEHLHDRPGVEPVFVDQMEQVEFGGHGLSIESVGRLT